jgi:hypothetical protein
MHVENAPLEGKLVNPSGANILTNAVFTQIRIASRMPISPSLLSVGSSHWNGKPKPQAEITKKATRVV